MIEAMCTPPHPMNIMADPRVFRGSVAARQRAQQQHLLKEMEEREAEERWRTSVVRNRLSMALGATGVMGGGGDSPMGIPLGRRIARLNGPIGRRAAFELDGRSSSGSSGRSIDAKMPPLVGTVADMAERRRHGTPASDAAAQPLPELRDEPSSLRNVRFHANIARAHRFSELPFCGQMFSGKGGSREPSDMTMPSLSHSMGFPRRRRFGQLGIPQSKPKHKPLPHKVEPGMAASDNRTLFTRHTKQWGELPDITNPPPTAMGPMHWTHTGIQTDEMRVFDEIFEPLVKEMVTGVIADAQRMLLEEDELQRMEQQNKQLLELVVTEKKKNTELFQNIQQQSESQKALEEEKKSAEHLLDAMECRKTALNVVDDVTNQCLNRLMDRAMIKDDAFKKDVAADTRQLEKHNQTMQKLMDEVQNDFFPYVYQKAERIFVHTLTNSFLKDALFSNNAEFRADAHERLNEKIAEYNRLLRRTRPGRSTQPLDSSTRRS